MQIPCLSPAFDANWIGSRQLERAAELLARWSKAAPGVIDWGDCLQQASSRVFGAACAQFGGGGGIPFLNMFGERFPRAQFLVTGVLGHGANAHASNEFMHLPTARLTAVLAGVLAATTGVHR